MPMLDSYRQHVAARAALGIPPLPLSAAQTEALIELLKNPPAGEEGLLDLLAHRIPSGVDDAAQVKAHFLAALADGSAVSPLLSRDRAVELLGTMQGGYNVKPLVDALDDAAVAQVAADGLKQTLLVFDAFHDVEEKMRKGNPFAQQVIESWARAEWFVSRPEVPKRSPSACSRWTERPIPTTCRPRRMPGRAPTFRCMHWPC